MHSGSPLVGWLIPPDATLPPPKGPVILDGHTVYNKVSEAWGQPPLTSGAKLLSELGGVPGPSVWEMGSSASGAIVYPGLWYGCFNKIFFTFICSKPQANYPCLSISRLMYGGRYGSGGKSCRLVVGGLPVRSHPGHVEVSLSKTPNPQLLLMLVGTLHGSQSPLVCECVCEWVNERLKNCTALWIKALYKCSPFNTTLQ